MHLSARQILFLSAVLLIAAISFACSKSRTAPEEMSTVVAIKATSPSFTEGQSIPSKFTCDGENLSPPLKWDQFPAAKSFTVIVDDPDAPSGNWVHWVLYDLPASAGEIPEGVEPNDELTNGAKQGLNDFKHIGYGGPCPPAGASHRYYFRLYALDTVLGLKPGATLRELEDAMKGHVLGAGRLMGTYKRP